MLGYSISDNCQNSAKVNSDKVDSDKDNSDKANSDKVNLDKVKFKDLPKLTSTKKK